MPSNRTKYSQEMREQTAKFIIESGKSATSVAEEMGIDTNTVCRWVRDHRRKHQMPSYAEEKGLKKQTTKKITNEINIPTIGIGASNNCDGQILVFDDLNVLND